MESSAHDVVVVTSEHGDGVSALPVPDSNRLIIRSRDDPRVLGVELHRANVVQVPQEREQATPKLVAPHLDLVIIPCEIKTHTVSIEQRTAGCFEARRV